MKTNHIDGTLSVSEDCFPSGACREKLGPHFHLHDRGRHLTSEGKVANVLVINDSDKRGWSGDFDLVDSQSTENSQYPFFQTLLANDQRFIKVVLSFISQLRSNFEISSITGVYVFNLFIFIVISGTNLCSLEC